ncbi:protein Smg [Undibacterium squillarum]|uniref:Protein Smg homolog n=2 Tax=Undibacterium squillarum TaxID=1131567 RepID=A0ABQ2XXC4_9BURK|nr:protein Smg [Undibacterium squillarum]
MKKLAAVGFDQEDISDALTWLSGLSEPVTVVQAPSARHPSQRVYAEPEAHALGEQAIGFIQFLELAGLLGFAEREIVIERALAVNESPLPLDKLKIIVLMVLWSQGLEPDMLMLDELLLSEDDNQPRILH